MKVFVLGAGASVHANYPLATALGTGLAGWIEKQPKEHRYRACLSRIIDAYRTLDDFEAILTDLMMCQPNSVAAGFSSGELPNLRNDLEEAIREYFDSIRMAPTPLYAQLARTLSPGDVVITFNYDLGVERALAAAQLWDISDGYGFQIGNSQYLSSVALLKLHGSTNWRALLFGGRTGCFVGGMDSLGSRPALFFRSDCEYLGFPDFVDPNCARLSTAASSTAMIMPALPKRFYFETTYGQEWSSFWDGLWNSAAEAISEADHIVVIGYSLPSADERARELLLGASNKSVPVTICCGDGTRRLEQEFRDHNFSRIDSTATRFEDFLASKSAKAPIATGAPVGEENSTLSRLRDLVGKKGLLVTSAGEVPFTFLRVVPPADLPSVADEQEFQNAITRSNFLVRFDDGILLDGSDTRNISGFYVSSITGRH
ncbi:MAG: hypothetical protein P4L40_24975 [Terracidiphilus sp.]|nr:hypothetical protein [Terracidiphilus sp.]